MAKKRIMVVEDEGITAMRIQSSLEEMGYAVTSTAFSGVEAVKKAAEDKPDLVLMDIVLHGKMDGVEAAGKIHFLFNIPVVYLTAHTDEKMLKRIKKTEPFGYIVKPFDERELHVAVEIALYKKRMDRKLKENEKELRKHREQLMELVEERTSELQERNDELKKEIAERKLAEDQVKLMALFPELNPSPVLRFDRNGKVLMANKAAVELFGIGSLTGTSLVSILPGIEEINLAACIRDGTILSHSAQIGILFFSFIFRGIPDLNTGQIYGSDITERKLAEAEVTRASHLAALGELAAGVAHEINNPVNGIINYSQILANKSNPGSKEHDMAKRIIKESDRIAGIIRSLLSFARDSKEEKHLVYVHEIMSDSLALTETQIKKDGINLKVNIPSDLPGIIAQPQQIEQVFLNIISNARYALNQKYPGTHKDKIFEILGEETTIDNFPYLQITFYDKGCGIPAKIMDKITNPFFSTKPAGIGTGLGLSISYGIINNHGGKLIIDSVEGEFTQIIIELPLG